MRPYSIILPNAEQNGILFSSPHSGTYFPEKFLSQIAIDPSLLHYSGDLLVDELIKFVPHHGAISFINHYARTYVDTNRSPLEIDPGMFSEIGQRNNFEKSDKVKRGFGVISRKSFNGRDIYPGQLSADEIDLRLDQVYHPVHKALQQTLTELYGKCQFYFLLDCHSMPSYRFLDPELSHIKQPDVIIGNDFDRSCHQALTRHVAEFFIQHGLMVAFNVPYAGGYNTRHYCNIEGNKHVMQLEFNRSLYMNEETFEQNDGFTSLQAVITALSENLNQHLKPLLNIS